MFHILAEMDGAMKAALIGFAGVIIAAIITGVFTLIAKHSNPDKEKHSNPDNDNQTRMVVISIPKPTIENNDSNDSDDYIHNSFIPSLDDLEKEQSDNAFAEGLAIFLGVDRKEEDISLRRKKEG